MNAMTENELEWIPPGQAAQLMSERAGVEITVDDIRQLKRTGKIVQIRPLGKRMVLYNRQEILTVMPPKKRHPRAYTQAGEGYAR